MSSQRERRLKNGGGDSGDNDGDNNHSNNGNHFDLDTFLIGVESKLRGPFTSLDLAKVIQTPALRNIQENKTVSDYLEKLQRVIYKADKTTQLRILISLLGLERQQQQQQQQQQKKQPSDDNKVNGEEDDDDDANDGKSEEQSVDETIRTILEQSMEAPLHEDWVRVVAGLVKGIMFESRPEGINDEDNDVEDDDNLGNSRRRLRSGGEESDGMLDRTCTEVLGRIQKLEDETSNDAVLTADGTGGDVGKDGKSGIDQEEACHLMAADADPTFVPYRYAFLKPNTLQRVVPECIHHQHFKLNPDAKILSMDSKLERAKALEEQQKAGVSSALAAAAASKNATGGGAAAGAVQRNASGGGSGGTVAGNSDPGAAARHGSGGGGVSPPSATTKPQKPARPKTSMFMTRRPTQAGRGGGAASRTGLHTRRAGAAKALLAGGGSSAMAKATGAGGGDGASGGGNRAGSRFGGVRGRANASADSNRSKMMMIDVDEVQGLANQQKQKGGRFGKSGARLTGNKRKLGAATTTAGVQGATSATKSARARNFDTADSAPTTSTTNSFAPSSSSNRAKTYEMKHTSLTEDFDGFEDDEEDEAPPPPPAAEAAASATAESSSAIAAGALASAALSAYQAQMAAAETSAPAAASESIDNGDDVGHAQKDWREMLAERSNRLSEEDRERIRQFFVDRHNPTPDQSVFKVKLHEERRNDPETGEPLKETYYLELDYANFTSKQSKKTKRY